VSVYEVDGLGFLFGRPLDGQPCEHPAGTAWQVKGYLDASSPGVLGDGEPVVDFLCGVGEAWEAERQEAEAQRFARERESQERHALREAQDAEFQESLRIDNARQQAAEAAAGEAKAAKVREPSVLELRRQTAAAEMRERDAAAYGAGPEGEQCKLVLRLPNGKRVERAFGAADRVAAVYEWADCAGELAALAQSAGAEGDRSSGVSPAGFEVPEHFVLCVTFPRQPLTDKDADLKSSGLCPNAVIALSATDPPSAAG